MVTQGRDRNEGFQLLILDALPFLLYLAVLQVDNDKSEPVWEAL